MQSSGFWPKLLREGILSFFMMVGPQGSLQPSLASEVYQTCRGHSPYTGKVCLLLGDAAPSNKSLSCASSQGSHCPSMRYQKEL